MNEINDWIKEQLKKGYKKEQIKESLRRESYPQNIIDSVDSLSKKRNNFKFVLIFFIVVIAGIAFYLIYQNNLSNNKEVDTNEEVELSQRLFSVSDVSDDGEEILRLLEKRGKIVNITSNGFEPKELTIEVDQSVSFLNKDTKNHMIITNTLFKTEEIEPTNIFTLIAREEGEFEFYFEEYPEIKGKVIITKRTK